MHTSSSPYQHRSRSHSPHQAALPEAPQLPSPLLLPEHESPQPSQLSQASNLTPLPSTSTSQHPNAVIPRSTSLSLTSHTAAIHDSDEVEAMHLTATDPREREHQFYERFNLGDIASLNCFKSVVSTARMSAAQTMKLRSKAFIMMAILLAKSNILVGRVGSKSSNKELCAELSVFLDLIHLGDQSNTGFNKQTNTYRGFFVTFVNFLRQDECLQVAGIAISLPASLDSLAEEVINKVWPRISHVPWQVVTLTQLKSGASALASMMKHKLQFEFIPDRMAAFKGKPQLQVEQEMDQRRRDGIGKQLVVREVSAREVNDEDMCSDKDVDDEMGSNIDANDGTDKDNNIDDETGGNKDANDGMDNHEDGMDKDKDANDERGRGVKRKYLREKQTVGEVCGEVNNLVAGEEMSKTAHGAVTAGTTSKTVEAPLKPNTESKIKVGMPTEFIDLTGCDDEAQETKELVAEIVDRFNQTDGEPGIVNFFRRQLHRRDRRSAKILKVLAELARLEMEDATTSCAGAKGFEENDSEFDLLPKNKEGQMIDGDLQESSDDDAPLTLPAEDVARIKNAGVF
ncbi:hypothetical protein BJ741DRAFT_586529 [Chytriomyces cf. hyalinus JEL632]|nr:hypothetical protein BJ741DRAFT_586529 [Chytriomyces cf. hyalinus JEL632]